MASAPPGSTKLQGETRRGSEHPDEIGRYRVLDVLGEGGMGVVYLAEQTEPVRRQVALKILKLGMDTKQVIARFESERQALAVMEHPGIARVFDAGATESGRPFFVMERVEGVPITEYCDRHRLRVHERVRLFAQICRAVQHAHHKGVIHRDLKPSNVLVSESDGAPLCKVIDFGIARAVERTFEEQTRLTQGEQSPGTPAYMSPEQVEAAGRDIDTRSDIYSLGVLLYELLAGVLPFEAQAYRGWAFYAQHLVREPPAPSARFAGLEREAQARIAALRGTEPSVLRRQLRGELDWVVMRALEKERDRRYPTANGLALDLERFLANQPLVASPPSRAYLARKFVRRHRVGVAFAAVVFLLLAGFGLMMTVQAGRVADARDIAEARQGQAEDLLGFVLGDLRGKLAPMGRLDLLNEVGEQALAYFGAVPAHELTDHELFRRSQALSHLGEVRLAQGDFDAAAEAFRQSFTLAEGLAARDPTNAEWQIRLGEAHFWLGYVPWRRGDFHGALEQFLPYLRLMERLVEREPDNPEYRRELASANSNIGSVREAQGDFDGALEAFRFTLAINQDLVRRDSANLDWQLDLAHAYNTLAVVQRKRGELDGALESHRAELAIKQRLVATNPANASWQRSLAIGHEYLGGLQHVRGDVADALAQYRAGNRIHAELVVRDPANVEWQRSLALSDRLVALALLASDRVVEALAYADASRTRFEELVGRDPANAEWQQQLARTQTALGKVLLRRNETEPARAALGRALDTLDPLLQRTPDDPTLLAVQAEVLLERGEALERLGRIREASADWAAALQAIESVSPAAATLDLLALRATALLHLDRLPAARPLVEELIQRGYRNPDFVELGRRKGVIR